MVDYSNSITTYRNHGAVNETIISGRLLYSFGDQAILPVENRSGDEATDSMLRHSYSVFRKHWEDDKLDFVERSKLLLLNQANRVPGIYNLSSICTASTIVDTRVVFVADLKANASKTVLAHNHPSANLELNASDREVTSRLRHAGGDKPCLIGSLNCYP